MLRRMRGRPGINPPGFIVERQRRVFAQKIHVGLPQALNGSHVLPIALKGVGEHALPGRQHGGNDVFAEIVGRGFILFVRLQIVKQLFAVENIDAHGGLVAVGVFGLFGKLVNGAVLVRTHNAKSARLLQRNLQHGNGTIGFLFLVKPKHFVIIHLVNVVARKNHHVVRVVPIHKFFVLIDGIGRSAVPIGASVPLIGRQDRHPSESAVQIPRQAVADVFVERQRLILCQNTHRIEVGIGAVGQGEVNNPVLAAERNGGLGRLYGQSIQSAALAACQQHDDTLFFSEQNNHTFLHNELRLFLLNMECLIFLVFRCFDASCFRRHDRRRVFFRTKNTADRGGSVTETAYGSRPPSMGRAVRGAGLRTSVPPKRASSLLNTS